MMAMPNMGREWPLIPIIQTSCTSAAKPMVCSLQKTEVLPGNASARSLAATLLALPEYCSIRPVSLTETPKRYMRKVMETASIADDYCQCHHFVDRSLLCGGRQRCLELQERHLDQVGDCKFGRSRSDSGQSSESESDRSRISGRLSRY